MPSLAPTSSSASLITHPPKPDFSVGFEQLFSKYGFTGTATRVQVLDTPAATLSNVSPKRKTRRWYTLFSRQKLSDRGTTRHLNSTAASGKKPNDTRCELGVADGQVRCFHAGLKYPLRKVNTIYHTIATCCLMSRFQARSGVVKMNEFVFRHKFLP
jgi:hypothetical protein